MSFEEEEVKADKRSLSMELPHEVVWIIFKLQIERLNNVSVIVGRNKIKHYHTGNYKLTCLLVYEDF